MIFNHTVFFGALSSLMMLCGRVNYFHSIWRGKTKPHVFSWLIWGTISSIGFAAQVAEGAGPGSWARGISAATCMILTVIALKHRSEHIKRSDWITFIVALSAIPLWIITKTPVWSVILVCIIDTLGYFPTVRKSWHKPHEETARSYMFSCLAAGFALLAIQHYTLSTWLYSALLTCTNGMMAAYLLLRRRHKRRLAA